MKTGDISASGKCGSAGKGITTARRGERRNMTEVAQGWNELEEWERDAWWKRARQIRIRIHWKASPKNLGKARTRTMRGEELYVKINRVLRLCGFKPRRLPPPPPKFGANPVKPELRATLAKGRLMIKLGLKAAPVNDIMVFGSPPRRAGQGPGGNYAFLGLSPLPEDGEIEIAEMYLTKLKEWRRLKSPQYQVPLEGSRICIRTMPLDNGWEGKGWMQVSHGLVRGPGKAEKREDQRPIKG